MSAISKIIPKYTYIHCDIEHIYTENFEKTLFKVQQLETQSTICQAYFCMLIL